MATTSFDTRRYLIKWFYPIFKNRGFASDRISFISLRILLTMDDEAKASDLVTLTRFLLAEKNDHEMTMLMQSIQLACKVIASAVRKAGMSSIVLPLASHICTRGRRSSLY